MNKRRINEVIVVEGIHDKEKILKCVDADVITSSGTHISKEFLDLCQTFHKTRGLIVFTDPDGPGERIRRKIIETVGTTKHASLNIIQSKKKQKVGIEHADVEDILMALDKAASYDIHTESLSWNEFVDFHLTGGPQSRVLRDQLSEAFHFPRSNAKTTFKYLNMMQIDAKQIQAVLKESDV